MHRDSHGAAEPRRRYRRPHPLWSREARRQLHLSPEAHRTLREVAYAHGLTMRALADVLLGDRRLLAPHAERLRAERERGGGGVESGGVERPEGRG